MSDSVGHAQKEIGIGALFLFLFWPLLGFWGDLPSRVHPPSRETLSARAAAWTSVIFHVAGATLMLIYTESFLGPLWLAFAFLVLMRRAAAMKGVPVRLTEILPYAKHVHVALPVLAGVGMIVAFTPLKLISPIPVFVFAWVLGRTAATTLLSEEALYARWVPILSTVFRVPDLLVTEQAGLYPDGRGVVIDPVPPAMAQRLPDRETLDDLLAAIEPNLMFSEDSSPDEIQIIEASSEHMEHRRLRAESGGLVTGVTDGDTTVETPELTDDGFDDWGIPQVSDFPDPEGTGADSVPPVSTATKRKISQMRWINGPDK